RDLTVTGVQTCALPISQRLPAKYKRPKTDDGEDGSDQQSKLPELFARSSVLHCPHPSCTSRARILFSNQNPFQEASDPLSSTHRSEERRVGKECRYRWT